MSKALLRSILELRPATRAVLTHHRTALSPIVSRSFATATTTTTTATPPLSSSTPTSFSNPSSPAKHPNNASNPTDTLVRPTAFKKSHPLEPPSPIPDSVQTLLPILAAQPGHYITVHIHGFPYLVQEGDEIRLPFKMPNVVPGDVLRLDRASVIGSRDYTMKGAPTIDERLFECRATVVGVDSEPMRIKIKKKRRARRMRTVRSKHRYTLLRISELSINNVDELDS